MTEASENLQNYDELFANRFTSEDHEYQQYLNRPADPPPIVEDWRGRGGGNQRGRDNRYQDRRHGDRRWGGGGGGGGGGRDWGADRGWRGGHHGQQHWHNRDRDRYGGHGSGYQSGGPPSSNQGYNPYHQRPHYDRY